MRARVEWAGSKVSQHVRLSLAVMGLALAAFVLFVPGSHAVSTSSPFELDGNVATNHADAGLPDDWDRVFAGTSHAFSTSFIGQSSEAPGNDITYFTGGGSKDTLDIPNWAWNNLGAPDKAEITDAYSAAYVDSSDGHTILYFGADRYATNGDTNLGFWFTQQPVGLVHTTATSGTFSGAHTNGDLFVLSAFGNGGTSPTITVYEWQNGSLNLLSSGTPCVSSGIACAFVNTSATAMPVPWPYTPKSGTAGQVPQNGFFEGGIDLDSLFSANQGAGGVPCFSSFLGETRSSDQTNAELEDFALGGFNSCGTVKIVKDAQPNGQQAFGYHSDLPGASTFSLTDDGTSANTKEVDSVKAGTYTVSEDANPTGWNLSTIHCDDPSSNSTTDLGTRTATINVAVNETVTCTFTNQKPPTLTVNKVCNPSNDAGKFNLQIDSATAGTGGNVGCGGTTGAVTETIDKHTVGETAGANTSLSDYTSVIGGDCAADGTITLAAGQNAVCTITNSRKATLTVNKVCVPSNDTGKFNLQVDSQNAKADATCGTGTGALVYGAGAHVVGETGGTDTDLSNYTQVIGGACDANGNVTLAAGDSKTCTITNTRKPTLTVNKVCVPANDAGKFDLQIDGQTAKADATCGTGTGAVVTSVGAHTVGELAGTGNDLSLYTSVIGGACSADGKITLAAGENAVCTITNTRKPSITVNKVCNPTTDDGKFTLQIDGSTAKADATCGTGTGAVVASVGSHTVAEAAGTGTSLSNYTSVIGGDCAANGSVTLAAGQSAVCTITNTRKPTLTVNKVCVPADDAGKFNLQIDGQTAKENAACGTGTGAVVSSIGSHTVGETYGTGTSSSNYFAPVFGGDCSSTGSITLAAGQNAVCTITNNRKGSIAITKTPASQAVDSGGTATFTITVTNTGPVTLTNVTVTDPLSTNCAKTIGTLTPGQVSTYSCTQGNVTAAFTNTATVTGHPPFGPDLTASASANVTVNAPPPPPATPSTPAPTVVDLAIVKTANPTSLTKGANVTYTLTVTNNGPVTDTAVQVADSLPFGVNYVSATSSQGTCTGTAVVQCNVGTMTNGQKVTITIVGSTANTGTIVNTATVVGALPETTLTNNTSSVSITVAAPPAPKPKPATKPFKPPVVKPKPKPVPPPCYAVVVAPKTLTVGKNGHLQLRVTAKNKAIAGVKIEVKGAGILKLSGRTNSAGKVTLVLHPKKAGIVLVKPASYKGCANPRIGVIGAFTPPVTG